jgi:hypothetical protein
MARLTTIGLLGSLSNISVYKRHDLDEPIVRKKGGPTRHQVKKSEHFEKTRLNNSEFGGRSTCSKWINDILWPLKPMADYPYTGSLNKWLKAAQELDTVNEWGKRSILLSKDPGLLTGFSVNKRTLFDSIVRVPLQYELLKDTLYSRIDIPALTPGLNFVAHGNHPLYSFTSSLGVIPDFHHDGNRTYRPAKGYENRYFMYTAKTDWYPVTEGSPATTLEIQLENTPPDNNFSLMLCIGVRFGTIGANNKIEQVKYVGSGKILAMK